MADDVNALLQQEQDANERKARLRSLGVIGDTLSNGQSVGNFFLGQMNGKNDGASKVAEAQANAVADPMTNQEKAFSYLKQKQAATQAQDEMDTTKELKDPNSRKSMALKALAPRWGVKVTPQMSGYDVQQLIDPKKMMETEAEARVQLGNQKTIHQMDASERAKDRALDRGLKEKEMDFQRFKSQGVTDPNQVKAILNAAGPNTDPSELVKKLVPEHHQNKVYEEIESAQNTAKNAPLILKAFDDAANNLHAADFVPGVDNADQKALHALMGPTFKDVEGTVRQAAMDNMNKNTTPQFGDGEDTLKKKRDALVGYLRSKSSASTAKGYGLDLSQFPSTSFNEKQKLDTGGDSMQTRFVEGVTYRKVKGGWEEVPLVGQK